MKVKINNQNFKFIFYDTPGLERYEMANLYCVDKSDVVIFFYNVTSSEEIFKYLEGRIKEINDRSWIKKKLSCFLIGTFADLKEQRTIQTETFRDLCKEKNINFVDEISLKTISQEELKTLFESMVSMMNLDELKRIKKQEKKIENKKGYYHCIIS